MEIAEQFTKELDNQNLAKSVRDLSRPNDLIGLTTFIAIWLVCLVAFSLTWQASLFWTPLTILIFGVCQRALGNLHHDACHGLICKNRTAGDLLSNWLIGYLTFSPLKHYREEHLRHHRYLGDPVNDPDTLLRTLPKGRLSELRIFSHSLCNSSFLRATLLGYSSKMSFNEIVKSLLSWTFIFVFISLVWNEIAAFAFLGLWFMARCLVFYPVTVFREISEHLSISGSIFDTTRQVNGATLLRLFFHPLNNQYHIAHHLFPVVPWFNLPRLHLILAKLPVYQGQTVERSGYFFGSNSAAKGWITDAKASLMREGQLRDTGRCP